MLPSRLITPLSADAELVTVSELAWNCRLTTDPTAEYTGVDAVFLGQLQLAAREYVEGDIHRCLVPQLRRAFARDFADEMLLSANLIEIVAVNYYDAEGAEQVLDAGCYIPLWSPRQTVDGIEFRLNRAGTPISSFPTVDQRSDAVNIEYRAGYVTKDKAPNTLRQAIIMLASHWYEHRETANITGGGIEIKEIPYAYEMLVSRHRVEGPIA